MPDGSYSDEVELGAFTDVVRVQLGNDEVKIAESYEVEIGIFTQPSAFALTLGDDDTAASLWKRYPPRTPFKLYIGDRLVQTGFTDSRSCGGSSTTFAIRGRDTMQDIHDSYTKVEKTYTDKKHVEFIRTVYDDAGFDVPTIHVTNEAMRKAMALGVRLPDPAQAKEQVEIPKPVQIKMGDTYYGCIKRVLDRAGLFLYAAANGELVLAAPDAKQPPFYKLVHAPNDGTQVGDITNFAISDSTIGRVSYYKVYARGGGKQFGVLKFKSGFPDEEMERFGYTRTRTFRDWHCSSDDEAELMARRKIAEERRRSWRLAVTVAGHSTLSMDNRRAVWTPDTLVQFDSDVLDLHGPFYIESVSFRRGADGTSTELHLIRPEDLIFGFEDA